MVADVQRLLQRLHAIRVALDALHAEEVRRRAGREHEIVVRNLAVVRQENPARLVDAFSFRHEELDIRIVAEERADRVRNLVLGQDGRRDLIQQRLEQLEVVAVDERDLDIFFSERLRELDAAESGTDDDDMWFLLWHD